MSNESELDPTFIAVSCPHCEVKLRVRSTLAGKAGTCPKCHTSIAIPAISDYCDESPEIEPEDAGPGYRLATPLAHEPDDAGPIPLPRELVARPPEHGFLDQLAHVRQVGTSKPPKLVYFSGVFNFPWYANVWSRWIWLVLGGTSISVIPVLGLTVLSGSSGYSGVGLAFFAMPQIWLTLWTGSYAASCGLQVFEDTAAGNDSVTSWPEPNWREWMWVFLQQGYVALMVLAIAYGIGKVTGLAGREMLLAICGAELMLFPLFFLSILEANSLVALISPTVVRTLRTKPGAWLGFYGVIGCLAALWSGLLWLAARFSLTAALLLNGLLFGTLVLIYFRVLGRLAWSISHQHRKKRKTAAAKGSPSI